MIEKYKKENANDVVCHLEYNSERKHLIIPEYGRHLQKLIEQATDIKDDGWNRWHQTSIKNIEVKNGEVEIGFILNGRPDTWGSIDDIEFYVQK